MWCVSTAAIPSNSMIRLAIIGCGGMTKNSYLPRFQHVADQIRVVAAVDTQQDRADHAASLFETARAETDYRLSLIHI